MLALCRGERNGKRKTKTALQFVAEQRVYDCRGVDIRRKECAWDFIVKEVF